MLFNEMQRTFTLKTESRTCDNRQEPHVAISRNYLHEGVCSKALFIKKKNAAKLHSTVGHSLLCSSKRLIEIHYYVMAG